MKAYFTRKPSNIEEVMRNAERAKAEGSLPIEVNPIAQIRLKREQYLAFCRDPQNDWDFLAAHADRSMFTDTGADCVIIKSPDMASIAVCCEGYTYGRYVGCLVSPFDLKVVANSIRQAFDESMAPLFSN